MEEREADPVRTLGEIMEEGIRRTENDGQDRTIVVRIRSEAGETKINIKTDIRMIAAAGRYDV